MNNLIPHNFSISKEDRNLLYGHSSFVIWFTGLSGSGKSTIANAVEQELFKRKIHTCSLDGDNIRHGFNKDLGFCEEDRKENLRRIAEVSLLLVNSGIVVITSFISPLKEDRECVKRIIGRNNFIEIYVNTSLEECERRDPKGFYKKARAGEIEDFTGISSSYEIPINPDLEVNTETENLEDAVERIVAYIEKKLTV